MAKKLGAKPRKIGAIKKSPWISFFNSGGCLPGDTQIILGNGEILSAKEMVDNHLEGNKFQNIAENEVLARECEGTTLSWENYSPKIGKITRAFKLKAPKRIIEIRTVTSSLKLTPEHKVLVDKRDGPQWIEAGKLKGGDKLYAPRKIKIKSQIPLLKKYGVPYKYPNKELMYILGLIASDGCISLKTKKTKSLYKVRFDNNEKKLIEEYIKILRKWSPSSKITCERVGKLYRAGTYNQPFVKLAHSFGLKSIDRKEHDFRPIFKLPENLIASFLAGFFDGDGSIMIVDVEGRNKSRVNIEFAIKEKSIAKQIQLLLKRLGIASKVNASINKSSFGIGIMHKTRITFHDDIFKFIETIPTKHPKKKTRFKEAKKILKFSNKKQARIYEAPALCGQKIRGIRKTKKIKQRLLGNSFVSMIERGKKVQKNSIQTICEKLKPYMTKDERKELEKMTSDDFYLDPINEIKKVNFKDKFVYNFTVEGMHSYIPEGAFVVSNCNGCAIECVASTTPRYDIERFGCLIKASARQCDILLVTGPGTLQCEDRLRTVYEQMAEPRVVIGIGTCTISGGLFRESYSFGKQINEIVPVDIYIPGCPPRPEGIIHGLLKGLKLLSEKNGNKSD